MSRRRRTLSTEEQRLWAHVARHVKPLPGRDRPEEASVALPPAPEPSMPPMPDASGKGKPARPAKPPPTLPPYRPQPPSVPATPPVSGLERRERVALRRGSRRVEAVLDLHGMRQAEAQGALIRFLQQCRTMDRGIVLIITGKGGVGVPEHGPFGAGDERGVLRRQVPHWLRAPDLRPFVVGFEEASLRDGGAGALYVRLRRRGK